MMITSRGGYLIDRKGEVARLQMRLSNAIASENCGPAAAGEFERFSLLDGEMVVDHDVRNQTYSVRFLVYDVMSVDGQSVMNEPFTERYQKVNQVLG